MRPHGHRGPHDHPFRRHGKRGPWAAAHGLHRRVSSVVMGAVLVGGLIGAGVHLAFASGKGPQGFVALAAAILFVAGPLTWIATFRIAGPVRRLAEVANELHGGALDSRTRLPTGPGEVGEVGDALRGMADRVARQLRDQRALMAAVSHELRSPLGRARVLVEMGREGTAPPDVYDQLESEIVGMDGLVGDLLAAARIDFEAVTPRPLDALDVARRALELAGMPGNALAARVDPGELAADATLLARALATLLDNARRYGGRQIKLRVDADEAWVRFAVEDDGPGFAPGDEERAFEPFWRGPAADGRAVPRGEGLGLALVRQIAAAHGGTAGARNREEGGAEVWMELPR